MPVGPRGHAPFCGRTLRSAGPAQRCSFKCIGFPRPGVVRGGSETPCILLLITVFGSSSSFAPSMLHSGHRINSVRAHSELRRGLHRLRSCGGLLLLSPPCTSANVQSFHKATLCLQLFNSSCPRPSSVHSRGATKATTQRCPSISRGTPHLSIVSSQQKPSGVPLSINRGASRDESSRELVRSVKPFWCRAVSFGYLQIS